jgi:probable rRNA maturation factor
MGGSNGAGPSLEISFTISKYSQVPQIDRLVSLLHFAASRENLHGELGIWLCTNDEIADLHLRYMNVAGPTDVITFPSDDADAGGYLGDIAVSVETAAEQGLSARHSAEREIAFLCLHGLLHLSGYNDLDDESRSRMIARQEDLLHEFEQANPGEWRRETERNAGNDDPQRS